MSDFENLKMEIGAAKKRLMDLWELKGITDQEILDAAEEVDRLLNQHFSTRSKIK